GYLEVAVHQGDAVGQGPEDAFRLGETAGGVAHLGLIRVEEEGGKRLTAQQLKRLRQRLDADDFAVGPTALEQRRGRLPGPFQDQDTWTLGHGSSIPPGAGSRKRNAPIIGFSPRCNKAGLCPGGSFAPLPPRKTCPWHRSERPA